MVRISERGRAFQAIHAHFRSNTCVKGHDNFVQETDVEFSREIE